MDSNLPAINATLNGIAAVLISLGLWQIKRGNKHAHARTMIAATCVSAAFLAGYLYYHFVVIPKLGHTPFRREGAVKIAYYVMLITHIGLAALNLPMILMTLYRAKRQQWEQHRRLARWTWPIWFYVSVTGVLIYVALYHANPPAS